MASFCAYPAWYIFPRWRRPRAPLGPPGGCSIYRRRFILLAAHSYPLLLPASPFPLFSFPICVPVRLACRLASRLVVRLVSCVPLRRAVIALRSPCRFVLPCRPACPCVPSARLVSVVSFPLVISFGLARVRLVSVLMPGSRVRAVSFCSSLVPTRYPPPGSSCSRLRRGVGRGVMSHGRRFALVGSSVPSLLLFATRSLVA